MRDHWIYTLLTNYLFQSLLDRFDDMLNRNSDELVNLYCSRHYLIYTQLYDLLLQTFLRAQLTTDYSQIQKMSSLYALSKMCDYYFPAWCRKI